MIGYQTVVMNDVRIRVDLTTTLDGKLSESAVGLEEVIVQAERPMIQTMLPIHKQILVARKLICCRLKNLRMY